MEAAHSQINDSELRSQITSLRAAIRYHRGQVSDYRCWVDDIRVYHSLGLENYSLPQVPGPEIFMPRCEAFWKNRQRGDERGKGDPTLNSAGNILPLPIFSDSDLESLSTSQLEQELKRLKDGIVAHESKGFLDRKAADDEVLYALLPESFPWSSALPPREVLLANCARFCGHCQQHPNNFFEWTDEGK